MSPRLYVAKTKAAEAAFSVGEFEHSFTAEEETDWVGRGLLEIVPCEYEVVGPRTVMGTPTGGTFTAALPLAQESFLVAGGHIERVQAKPAAKTTKSKEA